MKQVLRAAVLGSNDGLVSISSLLMGVIASHKGNLTIIGIAGIVAGAMSMAVGEYVSVRAENGRIEATAAALASSLSFTVGGLVALIGAFLPAKTLSIVLLTLAGLVLSGLLSAHEVKRDKLDHIIRVVLGGVLGMAITAGIGHLVKGL